MRARWIVAALAALALAILTMAVPVPWPWTHRAAKDFSGLDRAGGGAGRAAMCQANAKPANLNFTLKDMTGKDVKLSDFKGKVILLDFWATWCGPCKFEIPGFVELQREYAEDGLQVIGVSVDDSVEQLEPYVKAFKINYPVLQGLGHDDVQEAYGPMWGIPTSVIISRDGRICAKHTGLPPTKSSEAPLERRVKDEFEHQIKSLLAERAKI
jgi:thiol-disulfide isomerase/thioredoxin